MRDDYPEVIAASAHEAEWSRAAARWLPIHAEDSFWRFSHSSPSDLPSQGWKLHVSATILSAVSILEAVAPLLHQRAVLFKGPKSLIELKRLNCGLYYGFSQIGKFLTVYPRDDDEACALAGLLDAETREFHSPVIPFEEPVADRSSVYARFGAFRGTDGAAESIRKPDGDLVEDDRRRNPPWAKLPAGLALGRSRASDADGPLATRFRAYEILSQRGKGGVYKAIDLSEQPARPCVIKEGRAVGEMDWDGSDGRCRIARECEVLLDLQSTSVPAPRVYAHFVQGGNGYLAIEWIEGRSLAEALHPDNPLLDLPVAVRLGRDCANLLAQIHRRGWAWRDLKTANLMYEGDARLRPVDFEGAARMGTREASLWGTVGYVGPEWLKGGPVSAAQDCYALGVVLHQLFTNAVPKPGEPLPAIEAVRPDAPALVARIVAMLTHTAPEQRLSAERAARELEALWPQEAAGARAA